MKTFLLYLLCISYTHAYVDEGTLTSLRALGKDKYHQSMK